MRTGEATTTGARALAAVLAGGRVSLAGLDLRGVDLSVRNGAWAADRLLPGDEVVRLRLDGADLRGARLTGARLRGVSLRGAALDGALLVGADLRDADLSWAGLRAANVSGADLRRADLSYAELGRASLLTSDLSDATLEGADLREAILTAASLARARLRSADLRWARLTDASLVSADLAGARFEGAFLAGADLRGARVTASTVLRLAFLNGCLLDGTAVRRQHLEGGIGEAFTDLRLAAATYRDFESMFQRQRARPDADWAHRMAARLDTASHRPDRAPRYFPTAVRRAAPAAVAEPARPTPRGGRHTAPIAYYARHALRWSAGLLADAATGHGTCARRLGLALVSLWLLSGAAYHGLGALTRLDGQPVRWPDVLRFSAGAMMPVDGHSHLAATGKAEALALLQGAAGLVLLGALAHVAVARVRNELDRTAIG